MPTTIATVERRSTIRPLLHPIYPLTTARLLLRPYGDDDLEGLFSMHSREDVTRYLYWSPQTPDEAREMLERRQGQAGIDEEGHGLVLVATLRNSGEMVGDVLLRWVSQTHRQGEIGFILHPDHHGHGYATEAGEVMLKLGFGDLGLHRIVARCDARNQASVRVMERLGMRREAHLRENEFVKGEWCDELVYAILAAEHEEQTGPIIEHRPQSRG